MTHRGRKQNGVIVLDDPGAIPDGAEVSVRLLKSKSPRGGAKKCPATMYDRYKRFIGKAEGLPPDFSINHDHYLYGRSKRE